MMGTQRKAEHGVLQSSIALLQERFKQLQRVKEMREKRELLRLFSDYNNTTTTTTTSTTTTSTIDIINNNVISPSSDSTMQHGTNNYYDPCTRNTSATSNKLWCHPHQDVNDDDDEMQVFIPPNYYNHTQKPSSYSSSSSSSSSTTTSPSLSPSSLSPSLSPSSHDNILNHHHQNLNEVSLSLWPPAAVDHHHHLPRTSLDAPVLRQSMEISKPNNYVHVSTANLKFEDSHVSDVDTTLHL